ncbi:hypothetical protein L484_021014 [Morus notabilis]|uniref:BHLH domain-containing protein n=2 Tax=Morus notabilis TaxID=981085 RepID=W9QIE0_9ROSA|nr:hypothetical protein L484_021014 [Morus notabilis]
MKSSTKNQKISARKTRRRRRIGSLRRRPRSRDCCAAVSRRRCDNGGRTCSKVSDKLEALKNLIPAQEGEIVKADQLFQQTADYIVLLRAKVVILQKLIEFYGSSESENVVS